MRSSRTRRRAAALVIPALAFVVGAALVSVTPTSTVWAAGADLETVDPAEVGLSSERLERLDAGMQAMVDEGKLAGVVTLLARHGKVAFVDVAVV